MNKRKFFLSLGVAVAAGMSAFLKPLKLSAPIKPKVYDTCGTITRATYEIVTPDAFRDMFPECFKS